jgi:thiol-disulfide isomerase/thioredoxin
MNDQWNDSPIPNEGTTNGGRSFVLTLAIVLVSAIGFGVLLRQFIHPGTSAGGLIGKPAPAIKVETWLNGPGPTADELKGRVIVVDAWAHWCMPCRANAPELVALHKQYSPRGVVFVGLTHLEDPNEEVQPSQQFLKSAGITWPNGYGADATMWELRANRIPQTWVIDSHNVIVWDRTSREPIESAIDRALKEIP